MFTSLTANLIVFVISALTIIIAGSRLAKQADMLADQTGLGEALFGVVMLAGITSLPDFASTLNAAVDSRPDLALSNVMGSIAANLVFLGIADIVYRKANLEHAAASSVNLMLASLLIVLLTLPLLATITPKSPNWHIHPVTLLILIAYLFGLYLVHRVQAEPMWFPRHTHQTVADKPEKHKKSAYGRLWAGFILMAIITGISGWFLMESAKGIGEHTGLSDTILGGLLTAISTSTPELVTTIAAIRIGALTLAVSNIFGTNCFNMLVVAAADLGYTKGSIYHDVSQVQMIWGLVSILMTAILLLGLVKRDTYGIGRIGFESAAILSIYLIALMVVVISG